MISIMNCISDLLIYILIYVKYGSMLVLFPISLCAQCHKHGCDCVHIQTVDVVIMSFLNMFRVGVKSPKSTKSPVEISPPSDMRHEVHVVWDNDGSLQGLPESWRMWMKAANIR